MGFIRFDRVSVLALRFKGLRVQRFKGLGARAYALRGLRAEVWGLLRCRLLLGLMGFVEFDRLYLTLNPKP